MNYRDRWVDAGLLRDIIDREGHGSNADDTGAKFRNILLSIVKSFIGARRLLL